jgi:hypothetical protein
MNGQGGFRAWAVGMLACCLLLAACGTSAGQTSEETVSSASPPSAAKQTDPTPTVRSNASAPCSEGSALLGGAAGAIDFRVRCKPQQPGEEMPFSVSRSPLRGQGKPGIRGFRRHPSLSPPDGQHRFGRCNGSSGGGIGCSLRSSGSVLVKGRIWVDARTRCDYELVMTVSPSQSCRSDCTADQQVLTIFAGKPRGC